PQHRRVKPVQAISSFYSKSTIMSLLAGEVVHRYGILEQRVVAGDHGDAAVGDKVAGAVGFGVIADGGAFGEMYVAVDNAAADAAVASHSDVREQNGRVDFGIRIHANVRRKDRILDRTSGDDAAIRHDGVERGTHTILLREDEFGRRILALVSADGPLVVVEVEDRRHRDDIHVGFVIGLERAHVAPVERLFFIFVNEVVGEDAIVVDHLGQNVLAKVVAGVWILSILKQHGNEDVGVEEVDAHRPSNFLSVPGRAQSGLFGFFFEAVDAAVLVDVNHAEAEGLGEIDLDGGQGDVGSRLFVLLHHLAVVHFVDVIAGKNDDVFGLLGADGINVLINRIGCALIPLVADALHGWKHF